MNAQTKALLDAAVSLPEADRFLLVERLLKTLPAMPEELEGEEFLAELDRRRAEFDKGTANAIPWSELKMQE